MFLCSTTIIFSRFLSFSLYQVLDKNHAPQTSGDFGVWPCPSDANSSFGQFGSSAGGKHHVIIAASSPLHHHHHVIIFTSPLPCHHHHFITATS
jgi:hypothetical protein